MLINPKCGHKVEFKCWEKKLKPDIIENCSVTVKKVWPCGHTEKVQCKKVDSLDKCRVCY